MQLLRMAAAAADADTSAWVGSRGTARIGGTRIGESADPVHMGCYTRTKLDGIILTVSL